MNNEFRIEEALRVAVRPMPDLEPSRDLWPIVVRGHHDDQRWWWIDLGIAAAALTALLQSPSWLWLMAYHF
jgi:hypothetical protein